MQHVDKQTALFSIMTLLIDTKFNLDSSIRIKNVLKPFPNGLPTFS